MLRGSVSLLLVAGAVVSTPAPVGATVYRWIGPDGAVTYSDRPQPVANDPPPAPSEPTRKPPTGERDPAKGGPTAADELLELSGVKPQLATAALKLGSEFKPRRSQLNPDDAAAFDQIMARNFAADKLYTTLRGEFRRRAEAKKVAEVIAWLSSPLGRKITELEVTAGLEPDAGRRATAFGAGRGGPPPARVALMERIDWVAGVTDGSLESILAVARAMSMALNAALPPDHRQTTDQMERQIQQLRARSRAQLAQSTIMFMLYEYRSLEDQELEQYAEFLATDAGRWYSATMSKALIRTVALTAQRTAKEMIRAIPPQRWSSGAAASPQH
jgi:Domain of unknown function (DUF4124)